MKSLARVILLFTFLAFVEGGWTVRASAITILDHYIGFEPTLSSYYGKDVIGEQDKYDITKMDVNFVGDQMIVDIYSTYFDNIGDHYTQLGDLFLSIDGWHPLIPTRDDNFFHPGEDWEYVIALDDHDGEPAAGTARVYALDQVSYGSDILLSEHLTDSNLGFRKGQEVQYDGSADYLEEGTWSISPGADFLRISVGMLDEWSSIADLGFHYTMSCANDVIEGGLPAPEPGSMLLLGSGLLGLAMIGRGLGKKKATGK